MMYQDSFQYLNENIGIGAWQINSYLFYVQILNIFRKFYSLAILKKKRLGVFRFFVDAFYLRH